MSETENANNFYTPSQISSYISDLFSGDVFLNNVFIVGEVSGYKPSPSGHIYFDLKDSKSLIRITVWKSVVFNNPEFREIKNGQVIRLIGKLQNYQAGGSYSISPIKVFLSDEAGDIDAKIKALHEKLLKEGLFLPELKKPIPNISKKIAVITSPTGAVIHDIEETIKRRFPASEVILYPTSVQGENAIDEIINSLILADNSDANVLILARGGGSKTDLLVFNEERLVRAVANLKKPVVTSIGHQIDRTLVDLVSDKSADTPTAAAEIVTPDFDYLKSSYINLQNRLINSMKIEIINDKNRIENLATERIGQSLINRIENERRNISDLLIKNIKSIDDKENNFSNKIKLLEQQLDSINPQRVLERGYAVVRKNGKIANKTIDFNDNDLIEIQLMDGEIKAKVERK